MTDTRFVLRVGAIASMAATILLILMILLNSLWGVINPADYAIHGIKETNYAEYKNYVEKLKQDTGIMLSIDTIFIFAWIIAWIGIVSLARIKSKILANTALVIGLIAPLLDLLENGLLTAMIINLRGSDSELMLKTFWVIVSQLSYILTFAAAAVVGVALWNEMTLNRIMCLTGTVFSCAAVLGMYIPGLYLLSFGWYLAWFGCASFLLWRRAGAFS